MFFDVDDEDVEASSSADPAALSPSLGLQSPGEVSSTMVVDETSPEELRPRGLFDFEWENFPTNPVHPTLRREAFQPRVGPTADFQSPYEAFAAIWTPEFMQKIAATNNRPENP